MSRDRRVLRAARMGGALGGSIALLPAMTVWAESPVPRDLAWTVGVALLVLALVANWLLRRTESGDPSEGSAENTD